LLVGVSRDEIMAHRPQETAFGLRQAGNKKIGAGITPAPYKCHYGQRNDLLTGKVG
jgi:hypothetical protein